MQSAYGYGIRCFDTSPAYGDTEHRLGFLRQWYPDIIVSTKVGETQRGAYRRWSLLSPEEIRLSVRQSRSIIAHPGNHHESATEEPSVILDYLWLHPSPETEQAVCRLEVIRELVLLRDKGVVRHIGLSAYNPEVASRTLIWADAVMVEYNLTRRQHASVIELFASTGKQVFIKKPLAGGSVPFTEGKQFLMEQPGITSIVIGTRNTQHIKQWL